VKSQSPIIGTKRQHYRRHRPSHSSTFRSFRAAFTGKRGAVPPVSNGPYRKDGTVSSTPEQLLHLSKSAILAGLLAVLLAVLCLRGWQMLESSGAFRLRQITVQGCRTVREEQLLALADLRQGMPLFGFNLPEAERRIRQHPWIDRISITRSWPDTLLIQVQERRPLALINLEGRGLHYVDQDGVIFAPIGPGQDLDFPVITGISPPEEAQGFRLHEGAAADAVQFLRLAAQGNPILPMQALSEVHVSREQGIIAYLAERPFPIHIGYGNIRTRYYQLVKLLEHLYRKEKIEHIREIRMDYQPGRILVASLES
jgi:cell division protein FtsQ